MRRHSRGPLSAALFFQTTDHGMDRGIERTSLHTLCPPHRHVRAVPLSPDRSPLRASAKRKTGAYFITPFHAFCSLCTPRPRPGNRKAARRAQKSTGTEILIPYTGAREKQVIFSPPPFPPSVQKREKEVYCYLQMRGFHRCVWTLVPYAGGGVFEHPVPALHFLLCSTISIIILNLPKFNEKKGKY